MKNNPVANLVEAVQEHVGAHDPTGEKASKNAHDDILTRFDSLLKEAFENPALKNDKDLIDILTDELHEKIDLYLTNFYQQDADDGLDVSEIEDTDDDFTNTLEEIASGKSIMLDTRNTKDAESPPRH